MKSLQRNIGFLLLGTAILIVFVTWFLLGTEPGAQWLIKRLLTQTPVVVKIAKIEGRLTNQIVLHQVESNWQGGSLVIEELTLDWSLWQLLNRRVEINQLNTRKMTVRNSPEKKPSAQPIKLTWPVLPIWMERWQFDLKSVSLRDTRLIRPDQHIIVEQLDASIDLEKGQLSLASLDVFSQGRRLQADGVLNLLDPAIKANIHAIDQDNRGQVDINLNFKSQVPAAILSGPFQADVILPGQPNHRVGGTVEVAERQLQFTNLQIERTAIPGTMTGNMTLLLDDPPSINADLHLSDWAQPADAAPDMVLNGSIAASGTRESMQGQFNFSADGSKWYRAQLAGEWHNRSDNLTIDIRQGKWLQSQVRGKIVSAWEQIPDIKAELTMTGLDPAQFSSGWSGSVNFHTVLDINKAGEDVLVAFDAAFHDSLLRGVPLQGTARGQWHKDILNLDRLALSGDGFVIKANGSLANMLNLSFEINDLGGLVPDTHGTLHGQGWVALQNKTWLADIAANGDHLSYETFFAENVDFSLIRMDVESQARMTLKADKSGYGASEFRQVNMLLNGDIENHDVTLSAEIEGTTLQTQFEGHFDGPVWQGSFSDLLILDDQYGTWRLASPFTAQINDRFLELGLLRLSSNNAYLSLEGRFQTSGFPEQMDMNIHQFPLPLLNNLITPVELTGSLEMEATCSQKLCQLQANGLESIKHPQKTLIFKNSQIESTWDAYGFNTEFLFELPTTGVIKGQLFSESPRDEFTLFPMSWTLNLREIPINESFRFPEHLNISGDWQGQARGTLKEDLALSGKGEATANDATFSWLDEDSGQIDFTFNNLSTEWEWFEDSLSGKLTLVIEEHGQLTAEWELPIPARLPISPAKNDEIIGYLDARFTEKGLTGILWPEYVQETSGDIEIDTFLEGTWNKPSIRGTASLNQGRGYLPGPGIQLEKIKLEALFDEQQILFENFSVFSVPAGSLSGRGTVKLNGWKPGPLDIMLRGKDFILTKLPELEIKVSPDLQITGTRDDLHLTGDIHIPSFLATGREQRTPVQASPDVIVIGRETEENRQLPFKLSTKVSLILGDKVLVKMFGLDARLGGKVELTGIDPQHFSGSGEIYVEDGSFSTYGVKLGIEKGRATFAGGPLNNPAIDILATKKAAGAEVGVQIRGTAKAPDVKLYSEPTMADTDILSHIVLGRPLDQAGGETDPLMLAAGALLSSGDSAVLRSKLQSQLGIDTIEAESETGETNDTILRLGKYLTPDLYLSYGYAMFGQRSEIGLRYNIYKGLEAESKFGVESGADLYYRFEFEE